MSRVCEALDPGPYGETAGFKRYGTAHAAAVEVAKRAKTLRDSALDLIRGCDGLTADEVASLMGENILSIRPRVAELAALDLIEDSRQRRKNTSGRSAIVWRVRPATTND